MAHYVAITSNSTSTDIESRLIAISGLDTTKFQTGMSVIRRTLSGKTYCFGWQLVYEDNEDTVKALGGNSRPFKLYFVDGNTDTFKDYTGITNGESWFSAGNNQTGKGVLVVFNGWNYTKAFAYEGSNGRQPNDGILGVAVDNFANSYTYVSLSHAITKDPEDTYFKLPTITVFANVDPDFVNSVSWLVETRSRNPITGDPSDWNEIWRHGVNGGEGNYNQPGIGYYLIKPNLNYNQYAVGIKYTTLSPTEPVYNGDGTPFITDNGDNSFSAQLQLGNLYTAGRIISGDCRSEHIRNVSTNELLTGTLSINCLVSDTADGTGPYYNNVYSDTQDLDSSAASFSYSADMRTLEGALPTEDELYTNNTVKNSMRVTISGRVTDFMNSHLANELEEAYPYYPVDISNDIKMYVRPNSPKFEHGLVKLPRDLYLTVKNKPTTKYNDITFLWLANTTKNDSTPLAGYCVELSEVTEDGYRIIDDAAACLDALGSGYVVKITHKNDPTANTTQDNSDNKSGIIIPGAAIPWYSSGYQNGTEYPLQLSDFDNINDLNGVTISLSQFAKYHSSWLKPGAVIRIHVSAYTEDLSGRRYYSFWLKDPYQEGRNGPNVTIQQLDTALGVVTENGLTEAEVLVKLDGTWTEVESILVKVDGTWVEADSPDSVPVEQPKELDVYIACDEIYTEEELHNALAKYLNFSSSYNNTQDSLLTELNTLCSKYERITLNLSDWGVAFTFDYQSFEGTFEYISRENGHQNDLGEFIVIYD